MFKDDNKPINDDRIGDLISDESPDINTVSRSKIKMFFIFCAVIMLIGLYVSHAVSLNSVSLNSTSLYNYTNRNLTCNINAVDYNHYAVAWYINNTPQMSLYMTFGGNYTNAGKDYSGNNNTASYSGLITAWNSTGGYDRTGGLEVLTNDTTIQFDNSASLSAYGTTNRLTACVWVKYRLNQTTGGFYKGILGKYDFSNSTNPQRSWLIARSSTNQRSTFVLNWNRDSTNRTIIESNDDLPVGVWTHLCARYNGTLMTMIINGVQQTQTGTISGTIYSGTAKTEIGTMSNRNNGLTFNGTIDGVRIYSSALTNEEITEIYNNQTYIMDDDDLFIGDKWNCEVTAFNSTAKTNSLLSNSVTINAYYNNAVTINYPINNYHYYNWNTNITYSNTKYSNCNINDTRFINITSKTNVLSGVFSNNTGLSNTKINLRINCTDETNNISNAYVNFVLDTAVPFINYIYPSGTIYTNQSIINAVINFYDVYLYVSNVTMYNSTGYAYYSNTTYYNGTGKTDINKSEILPLNYYGENIIEACVSDSNSDSPDISKDTAVDYITNEQIRAVSDTDTKSDYDSAYNNVRYFDRNNIVIVRNVYVTDKSGNKRTLESIKFSADDRFIDDGKHIKSAWSMDKTLMAYDDILHINYECIKGCKNLKLFSDYNKNRIIDDTFTLMFHFKDLEKDYDLSFSYDKISGIMSVSAKLKSKEIFDKYDKIFIADPITAGLNKACLNTSVIYDNKKPNTNIISSPVNNTISEINYIDIKSACADDYYNNSYIIVSGRENIREFADSYSESGFYDIVSLGGGYYNSKNNLTAFYNNTNTDYIYKMKYKNADYNSLYDVSESCVNDSVSLRIYVSGGVTNMRISGGCMTPAGYSQLTPQSSDGDNGEACNGNLTYWKDGNYNTFIGIHTSRLCYASTLMKAGIYDEALYEYQGRTQIISQNSTYINASLLVSGNYEYYSVCSDLAGNYNTSEKYYYTFDNENPIISINPDSTFINNTQNYIYVSAFVSDFTLNKSEIILYKNSVLNQNITFDTETSINYNFTGLSDDTYSYKIIACDNAGNCAVSDIIMIDIHASVPSLNVFGMPTGITYNPSISALFSAFDSQLWNISALLYNDVNVSIYNYTGQTETCDNITSDLTYAVLNESGYNYTDYSAGSSVNGWDGDTDTIMSVYGASFIAEYNKPAGINEGRLSVLNGDGTETNITIPDSCYVNDILYFYCINDFDFYCEVIDSNNINTFNSCSEVTINNYGGSGMREERIYWIYNESESVPVQSCVNSNSTTLNTGINTILSAQGLYNYSAWAYDSHNNYNFTSGYFIFDSQTPYISLTNNSEFGILINDSVYFEFNVSDDNLNYSKLYIYNSSWILIDSYISIDTGIINYTNSYDSGMMYHYYANAYDLAGLSAQTEIKDFLIDTDTPSINVLYPINKSILHESEIDFLYSVNTYSYANVSLYVKIDGVVFAYGFDNISKNGTITIYNMPQGNISFNMTACSYNGLCVESDEIYFYNTFSTLQDLFSTTNPLSQSESIFLGVLFFAYFCIIVIGMFFKNPAFIVLGYIIGILIGIFLIKVNWVLGVAFILTNLFSMCFTLFKQ